jgi:hypothetical protein
MIYLHTFTTHFPRKSESNDRKLIDWKELWIIVSKCSNEAFGDR